MDESQKKSLIELNHLYDQIADLCQTLNPAGGLLCYTKGRDFTPIAKLVKECVAPLRLSIRRSAALLADRIEAFEYDGMRDSRKFLDDIIGEISLFLMGRSTVKPA